MADAPVSLLVATSRWPPDRLLPRSLGSHMTSPPPVQASSLTSPQSGFTAPSRHRPGVSNGRHGWGRGHPGTAGGRV